MGLAVSRRVVEIVASPRALRLYAARRVVALTLGLREGEGAKVARLFGFVFLLTAAAVLARSAQREIFLAAYPRSAISDAFLYSAGALGAASLGISALALRVSFYRLTQLLLGTAALAMALGRVALEVVPQWTPMPLYVGVDVLVSLVLSQGWAVVTEALDVRSAKRLVPLVGFGAGLAWTLGGLAVGALAKVTGPGFLLALAPVALLGGLGVLGALPRADSRDEAPQDTRGFAASLASGLRYLVAEPLVRVLALIITVELVVEKITDLQLLASAQERFAHQSGGISSFMGLFYGVTGAVTLLAPLVSGRILSRFGSTRALVAGQLYVLVGSLLFLLVPQFAVVVLLTGGDRVLKQALGGAARAQVMGALPSVRRVQTQALLRGVLAAAFSAVAAVGLKAMPAEMPVSWLSVASVLLTAMLVFITWRDLRKGYLLALQTSVDRTRLDLDGEQHELDAEQLTMLADELKQPEPSRASLALSLIGTAAPTRARPLVRRALQHPSSEVRAQAATVLGRIGTPAETEPLLAALTAAPDDLGRCACIEALADLGALEALDALGPYTTSDSTRVRALALVARAKLLQLGAGEGRGAGAALVAFEALLSSASPVDRAAAAWAVGRVPLDVGEVRQRFAPLLADSNTEVRRAAVGASGHFDDEGIVRALVFALEEPATAATAFEAVRELGDKGVARVTGILDGAPVAIVLRAAAALSTGGAGATEVLQRLLGHPDAQVRYRASRALVLRRRSTAWRPPGDDLFLRAIEAELAQGYRYHAALAAVKKGYEDGDASQRFAAGEVDSRIQETERRILALVAVVADPRIARLSHHLRDASPQVTARVLELVEESLDKGLAELVVPFLERQATEAKVAVGARRFSVSLQDDAAGALVDLGDEHLKLVALLAFREEMSQRFPGLEKEEEKMLLMVERLRFLRSVPVFKNLSPEDLMKLAEIATPAEYPAGRAIFKKGDPGDVLCVMVSGKVEIRDQGQVIATQRQNDFFGELALFDQEPRSADAVCVEDTELLEIGGADLDSLMERRPEIAREIIRVLARRLRKTTQELVVKTTGVPSPLPSAPR